MQLEALQLSAEFTTLCLVLLALFSGRRGATRDEADEGMVFLRRWLMASSGWPLLHSQEYL